MARQLADQFGFERVASPCAAPFPPATTTVGMLYDGEHYCFSKEYHLRIVDRVGGGDSYGGLIYALLAGKDSQAAIEFAVAASALKHSIEGDLTASPWRRSKSWPVETVRRYSADTGHGERRRNGTAHKIAEKYRWSMLNTVRRNDSDRRSV